MQSTLPVRLTSGGNIHMISGSLRFDPTLANPVPSLGPGAAGCTLHATDGSGGAIGWQIKSPTAIPAGVQDILLVTFDIVGGSGDNWVQLQGSPTGFVASDQAGANVGLGSNGGGLINLTTGVAQAVTVQADEPAIYVGPPVPTPVPVIAPAPTPDPITAYIPPGGGPIVISHDPIPLPPGTPVGTPGTVPSTGTVVTPGGGTVTPGGTTTTPAASGDGNIIAGIPNMYLIIGVAAAIWFMSSK